VRTADRRNTSIRFHPRGRRGGGEKNYSNCTLCGPLRSPR
jgi:hypothetical protein